MPRRVTSSAPVPTLSPKGPHAPPMASRGPFTHRRDSEYDGEDDNLNVNWLTGRSFLSFALFYLSMLVSLRLGIYSFLPQLSWEMGWTTTLVLHFVLSFLILHQSKGVPMWMYQGAYDDQTFWEQIDGGRPWTKARKMLLIIPILLSLITAHFTNYATPHLVVNFLLTGILIIAKLPEMMGVRLFGRKTAD